MDKLKYIILFLFLNITAAVSIYTEYDEAFDMARKSRPQLTLTDYIKELAKNAEQASHSDSSIGAMSQKKHLPRVWKCNAILYFIATRTDEKKEATPYERKCLSYALSIAGILNIQVQKNKPAKDNTEIWSDIIEIWNKYNTSKPSEKLSDHFIAAQAIITQALIFQQYPPLCDPESMRNSSLREEKRPYTMDKNGRDNASQTSQKTYTKHFEKIISNLKSFKPLDLMIFYFQVFDLDTLNEIVKGVYDLSLNNGYHFSRLDQGNRAVLLGRLFQMLTDKNNLGTELMKYSAHHVSRYRSNNINMVTLNNGWTLRPTKLESGQDGILLKTGETEIKGSSFLEDGFFLNSMWPIEQIGCLLDRIVGIHSY